MLEKGEVKFSGEARAARRPGAPDPAYRVPEYTANFAWGDDDRRSLYITASTSLYCIRVKVPGLNPAARVTAA